MMHRTVFCPLIVTFMLVYLFDVVMISAILCSLSLFLSFFFPRRLTVMKLLFVVLHKFIVLTF